MKRSDKDAWLQGPGDLREADVEDVPVAGQSVRVRALSAKYAADMQGQIKIETRGREQIAKVDAAAMELVQFVHGVIDPEFTVAEAKQIQEKFGPAFKKVIAKIDELSEIDKDAIEETKARFPVDDGSEAREDVGDGTSNGSAGPNVSVRAGA